jgi:predicted HTH transcriptional regulator
MWIPKDEQEIVSAMTNGSLEETLTFDAKREIPLKNIDTAKDVSALANTAGGVLLYGVDEDSDGRLTVLHPIVLENQRERIDQIVRNSVDEVPRFTISRIETQADTSKGYLVVVVPPSDRAPHMVIVKGERRFYGRGETGNYILGQTEVGRLYERRRLAESNILPELEKGIEEAPLADNDEFAHLHIVARPVFLDDTILTKALSSGQSHKELLRVSGTKRRG